MKKRGKFAVYVCQPATSTTKSINILRKKCLEISERKNKLLMPLRQKNATVSWNRLSDRGKLFYFVSSLKKLILNKPESKLKFAGKKHN